MKVAMTDVKAWLEAIGLGQYAAAFVENEITLDVLGDLNEDDLEKLGLSMGARKRFLRAFRESEASHRDAVQAPLEHLPERRQLTIMFCDLVGSTAMSHALDPEDLRVVMRAFQAACVAVVVRFDGYVLRYMGDGIMSCFGYPQAHEDDVERGTLAGLGIVDAIRDLNTSLGQEKKARLQVRIGVATGIVIAGDLIGKGPSEESAVVGETPNLASRLQELAPPDSVVISSRSRRLVGDLFDFDDLGRHSLKGFARPVRAWRVRGRRAAQSRFDATRGGGLTKLVGRTEELEQLLRRWKDVREGRGKVVLISGEAGIGKSRLIKELHQHLLKYSHHRLRYQCSSYHVNSVLYPVINQLELLARLRRRADPGEKLAALAFLLRVEPGAASERLRLFSQLLSIPRDSGCTTPPVSPKQHREQLYAELLDTLHRLAERKPVLVVVEDAHWIDPTSQELLDRIVARIRDRSVFIVVSSRPTYSPSWVGKPEVTSLVLNRLDRDHSSLMLEELTGGETMAEDVTRQILDRADGVPLFVEELTKTILESRQIAPAGDRYMLEDMGPSPAIPSTLQDSLMARLTMSGAKQIAQIGAVIGREFSYHLLAAASQQSESQLRQALERLTRSELAFERGSAPESTYVFKHALVQDVAYQSLLRDRRQQYHQRIARALEERWPETVEASPELLARHYDQGNEPGKAAEYWWRAARRAIASSAHVEAVRHAEKGLAVVSGVPERDEQQHRELVLQTTLGTALRAVRGYAAPEVGRAYSRAYELTRSVGDEKEAFQVLWGLTLHHFVRARVSTAFEHAQKLDHLATRSEDDDLRIEANIALGMTRLHLGELAGARKNLGAALAIYDPERRGMHTLLYGQDPGVFCLSYDAWALWLLGYPDQALESVNRAVALGRDSGNPYNLVFALNFAARVHQARREADAVRRVADEMIALSREHKFAYYLAQGTFRKGWALTVAGRTGEGIALLREGLEGLQATGTELARPGLLLNLAQSYRHAGRVEQANRAIDEALELVAAGGTQVGAAEMERLKGELLLSSPGRHRTQARSLFRRALATARAQRARSLELRVLASQVRLAHGRADEARLRRALAACYERFGEGHDTLDLREARQLIGEPGRASAPRQ
jgi:class 3 adenylate cyclase/predicted ATPase